MIIMELHNAIIQTLKLNGKPMTCCEIADALNSSKLYSKRNGTKIAPNQISARINKYPSLFIKDMNVKPMKISAR